MHLPFSRTRTASLALLTAALLTMSACASGDSGPAASTPSSASGLSITDPWVKAADSGMTAAFGTLVNDSDQDVRIVSATSELSRMELHEMAMGDDGAMVMRPKEGGFVVPAGGEHELGPGGDHVMFMDLSAPIKPGDEVTIVLVAADGSTYEFTAAARSFSGAEETYQGDGAGGMDMGGSDEPTMEPTP